VVSRIYNDHTLTSAMYVCSRARPFSSLHPHDPILHTSQSDRAPAHIRHRHTCPGRTRRDPRVPTDVRLTRHHITASAPALPAGAARPCALFYAARPDGSDGCGKLGSAWRRAAASLAARAGDGRVTGRSFDCHRPLACAMGCECTCLEMLRLRGHISAYSCVRVSMRPRAHVPMPSRADVPIRLTCRERAPRRPRRQARPPGGSVGAKGRRSDRRWGSRPLGQGRPA